MNPSREDKLISAYLDGSASPGQLAELNKSLRDDPALRARFLRHANVIAVMEELADTGEVIPFPEPPPSTRRHRVLRRRLTMIAAGLAAAIAVGWFVFLTHSERDPGRDPVARLLDRAGASFASGEVSAAGNLTPGNSYVLSAGMVTIAFRNGVIMTVAAPAEFEIVDELKVVLRRGQVRATTPESGRGFTIATPRAEFEDIGTEFGVSVDSESGASEAHVFDGQVDVRHPGRQAIVASLEFDSSLRVSGDAIEQGQARDNAKRFPTQAEVAFQRWEEASEQLRRDDSGDLLLYYGFRGRDSVRTDLLGDEALHGEKIDGHIEGARWVTGRWPGKKALLFDRQSDLVELTIPGEYEELSLAAWVNVDRLDFPLSMLLGSAPGFHSGSLHLQFNRGRMSLEVGAFPKVSRTRLEARLPMHRWVHVAATVDTRTGTTATWIDGRVSVTSQMTDPGKLRPGTCWIGAWKKPSEQAEIRRNLVGRIGELALWSRVLGEEEIQKLYLAGRPSAAGVASSASQ